MKLKTPRLILRPVTRADRDEMFAYSKDPAVGPPAGWKPHESLQETEEIIDGLFLKEKDSFAIVLRQTGCVVGTIGLVSDPKRSNDRTRMLGYSIAKSCWGKGLMTEAAKAVVSYGFEREKLELISAYCYPYNHRSVRVLEKCGFRYEGMLRRSEKLYNGQIWDELCYSITKDEYFE